jgi:hypothetical protein
MGRQGDRDIEEIRRSGHQDIRGWGETEIGRPGARVNASPDREGQIRY